MPRPDNVRHLAFCLAYITLAVRPVSAATTWAPKPVHGVCQPGYFLQHTFANTTCRPCDAGQFSPGNQSRCEVCPAGWAATELGSTSCTLCPIDTFGVPSRRACVSCSDPAVNVWADGSGRGWITARPGSTSFADCYDLDLALFYGWVFFIFALVFFAVVLLDGYVHKVALFRHLRVTQACARVMHALRKDVSDVLDDILKEEYTEGEVKAMETRGNLRSMIEDKMSEASDLVKYDRAERKRRREERRRRPKKKPYVLMFEAFVTRLVGSCRVVLLVALGLCVLGVAVILIVVYQMAHMFFQAMLMFRVLGNRAYTQQFLDLMASWSQSISLPSTRQYTDYLFFPVLSLLDFLTRLDVRMDFTSGVVDCTGAQAPFEFLYILAMFAFLVVLVQADSCAAFSPAKNAVLEKYVHLLHATRKRRKTYGIRALLLLGITALGPLTNPAVPTMQYLLTMITFDRLFESNGRHRSNPACDQLTQAGNRNGDTNLAALTSFFMYFTLAVMAWTAAKVLYPRACPPLLRKRINVYKHDPFPRWCWPDDGIDTIANPETPARTRVQQVCLALPTAMTAVGLVCFAAVDALQGTFYVVFYGWAKAVAHRTTRVDAAAPRSQHTLWQLWHALRVPVRGHADWTYVDGHLLDNLPSFTHFYRLWVWPRAKRTFRTRRRFPVPRPEPLPDLHWLAWRDVLERLLLFLRLGVLGWWDEQAVRDMQVPALVDALMLHGVVDQDREYWRDLLASVIIPRATLLRICPFFTPVAFFMHQMATSPLVMAPWPLPGEGTGGATPLPPYDVERFIAPMRAGAAAVGAACGYLLRTAVLRAHGVKMPSRALVPHEGDDDDDDDAEMAAYVEDAERRRHARLLAEGGRGEMGGDDEEEEEEGDGDSPQSRRGRPRPSVTAALAAVRHESRTLARPASAPARAPRTPPRLLLPHTTSPAAPTAPAAAVAIAIATPPPPGGSPGTVKMWAAPSTVGNALPPDVLHVHYHDHDHHHDHQQQPPPHRHGSRDSLLASLMPQSQTLSQQALSEPSLDRRPHGPPKVRIREWSAPSVDLPPPLALALALPGGAISAGTLPGSPPRRLPKLKTRKSPSPLKGKAALSPPRLQLKPGAKRPPPGAPLVGGDGGDGDGDGAGAAGGPEEGAAALSGLAANRRALPPIATNNNNSADADDNDNDAAVPQQPPQVATARPKKRPKRGDHRALLRALEAELVEAKDPEPYWPRVLRAPHAFLCQCSVFPICLGGQRYGGPTWMYLINLGQFVLTMWLAFSANFGSLDRSPAVRGAVVFLTYAVLFAYSVSLALRAIVPVGHFLGVQDEDFLPLRGFFSMFSADTWRAKTTELSKWTTEVSAVPPAGAEGPAEGSLEGGTGTGGGGGAGAARRAIDALEADDDDDDEGGGNGGGGGGNGGWPGRGLHGADSYDRLSLGRGSVESYIVDPVV